MCRSTAVRVYGLSMVILTLLVFNGIGRVSTATDYNRYLFQIFHKYGNGTIMTFEGLEHLMYSLGLGQLEFEPAHTVSAHRILVTNSNHTNLVQSRANILENDTNESEIEYLETEKTAEMHNVLNSNQKYTENDEGFSLMMQVDKDKVPISDIDIYNELQEIWPKGIFQEFRGMHDPKHRHPRHKENDNEALNLNINNVCLTPKSLLRLIFNDEDLHRDGNARGRPKTPSSSEELKEIFIKTNPKKLPLNRDHDPNHAYTNDDIINTGSEEQHIFHDKEAEYNEFVNTVQLTPLAFLKLCPALLMQIDQQVCVRKIEDISNTEDYKERYWQAWIYASGSVFTLSASGLLGVLIIPLMKSYAYEEILNFLISVAIGTLSGDALMHLLPHALQTKHETNEIHSYGNVYNRAVNIHDKISSNEADTTWIYACTFFSALFMYFLEHVGPLLRSNTNGHDHGHTHHHHHHSQSKEQKPELQHGNITQDNQMNQMNSHEMFTLNANDSQEIPTDAITIDRDLPTATVTHNVGCGLTEPRELNVMMNETELDRKKPHNYTALTPVAFMVILGDGLHNLTDGLAIGVAFGNDSVTGIATAFAVLCHELPHEFGDFALLLQSGVTVKRVIILNIISSILSFVGMAIGLLVTGLKNDLSQWIYAATAGTFLYIAYADLMPSISSNQDPNTNHQKRLWKIILNVFGIFIGGCIMIVIALNEHNIENLFK